MNFFNKIEGKKVKDPKKPTAVFFVFDNNKKRDYIFGFTKIIMKVLEKTHNIIIIGKDDVGDYESYGDFYNFNGKRYDHMKNHEFVRAVNVNKDEEDPNWLQNKNTLLSEYEKCFGDELNNVDKIIICYNNNFQLNLTHYTNPKVHPFFQEKYNEYFDYVGEDEIIKEKISEVNQKVVKFFDRYTSILAFSTNFKSIFTNLTEFIVDKSKNFKMVYGFIIDPVFYTPFFYEKNIPFTGYYFADDTRGTRNFKKFPIGELQHIIYDDYKEKSNQINLFADKEEKIEKTKDFFFAGTILQEKGSRPMLWELFLKDLRVSNSDLFIPLKANGMIHDKKENTRDTNNAIKKFPELYHEVKNHPLYSGHVDTDIFSNFIKKYKYGLILRCNSISDSLNYRPILYAKQNILPFLDEQYDPSYLQIPKEIQDQLIVKNHKDIEEKIKFFNQNTKLKEKLLKKLRDLFEVETFEKNYIEKIQSYFN